MQITKTLAAATLAISVAASGAHAGEAVITKPNNNDNSGILIGAVVLGLLGLLIYTGNNGDSTMSTKNAPDLGVDLPPQGGKVIADF